MPPMAALPESPPHTACRLHIDYRDVPAATALTTPGTLAVFGFGANAPAAPTDPRTQQQIAKQAGYETRRALARNA